MEVVVTIGTQKNSGGSQCIGGPPPAVGISWGLSEGHWFGERKRGRLVMPGNRDTGKPGLHASEPPCKPWTDLKA